MRILGRRARTAAELERALERGGVAAEERESALARLKELGYINDAETARFRARARGRGSRRPKRAARRRKPRMAPPKRSSPPGRCGGSCGDGSPPMRGRSSG